MIYKIPLSSPFVKGGYRGLFPKGGILPSFSKRGIEEVEINPRFYAKSRNKRSHKRT